MCEPSVSDSLIFLHDGAYYLCINTKNPEKKYEKMPNIGWKWRKLLEKKSDKVWVYRSFFFNICDKMKEKF